jgi:DNA topoisomerase I
MGRCGASRIADRSSESGPVRTSVAQLIPAPAAVDSAKAAGLRYTSDAAPGIRRQRRGRGFVYIGVDGRPIRTADEIRRIRALVIPPAWVDVWICPDPRGHLQATGRDARGRKQYRYHPRWRQVRDETKYHRMIGFAQVLPRVRRRTADDLRRGGLPREKVIATVVQLLEKTLIRVGNDEYARSNRSYGLTTMRDAHVSVSGERLRFAFKGKSGVEHEIAVTDRRLARIVKQCRDLPGQVLFQYLDDDGLRQTVGSEDVNGYLKDATGEDLTSKDFRTWAGTVLAAAMLRTLDRASSVTQARKNIVRAVEAVAQRLGNTKAVCRKCYIHPAIFEAYLDGSMLRTVADRARRLRRSSEHLNGEEAAVLDLLQRRLTRDLKRKAS